MSRQNDRPDDWQGRRTLYGLALMAVLGAALLGSPAAAEPGAAPPQVAKARMPKQSVQRLTPAQLRQAVAAYLEERLAGRASEVEVDVVDPSEATTLPGGRLNLEVIPGAGIEQSGRRRVHVVPKVDGRPTEGVDVVIDVNLFAEAVVPTRLLKPEEVIQPEDVAISRIRISRFPHQFVTHAEEAIGKSPGRLLHPQQPIRVVSLVQPYAVRKGDRVAIEARRGGLSIRAVGTTKGAGQVGSFVTVTNSDSGKDIRAKVIGPGLVEVDF